MHHDSITTVQNSATIGGEKFTNAEPLAEGERINVTGRI
jgi:hypothetical protein